MTRVFLVVIALLGAGCTGAAVGWGGTYQIIREEPELIIISYDQMVYTLKSVFRVSDRHCAIYGKKSVLVSNTGGGYGAISLAQFDCVSEPPKKKGEPVGVTE